VQKAVAPAVRRRTTRQEMDGPLTRAIADALPEGTTFGFNRDTDERTWMHVIGPATVSIP